MDKLNKNKQNKNLPTKLTPMTTTKRGQITLNYPFNILLRKRNRTLNQMKKCLNFPQQTQTKLQVETTKLDNYFCHWCMWVAWV